jgi:hypothetical protein
LLVVGKTRTDCAGDPASLERPIARSAPRNADFARAVRAASSIALARAATLCREIATTCSKAAHVGGRGANVIAHALLRRLGAVRTVVRGYLEATRRSVGRFLVRVGRAIEGDADLESRLDASRRR